MTINFSFAEKNGVMISARELALIYFKCALDVTFKIPI